MGEQYLDPKYGIRRREDSLAKYCGMLRQEYRFNNKVLFVQIPQFLFRSFNPEIAKKRGYYIFPPTGAQYLYESLKARGLEIRILDLNFVFLKKMHEDNSFSQGQWLDILKDYLESFQPSIVGVSCMYDSGIEALIKVLEFLKGLNRSVIIAGGVIPSYEWESLLKRKLCHFVIRGEGEKRINYLFDYLTQQDCNSMPADGICYSYQGVPYQTKAENGEVDFNTNLIDSYGLVEIEQYYRYGSLNPFSRMAGIYDSPFATIQMSRGCRGECTFCSVRDFVGKGIRKRSLARVLEEIGFLIRKRGIKHFEWLDDDLLFFKKDFKSLLEEVINRRWNITWSANNGLIATSIDDEMMRLMRDSGCIGFKIGIETGNCEMLKNVKKPATLDSFRKVARLCNLYPEIFVGGNFMLGFPDERFSQMMDSFLFHLELNLDWGAFTICQAIRGATAFSDFEDYFAGQIDSGGKNTRNFIPSRESVSGEINTTPGVLKGLEVFNIEPDSVPTQEQIREIWFTFNLVGNFINNKNLRPNGRADKFIAWVEMAQVSYPANPYMNLFLALAYKLKGDYKQSGLCYERALSYRESDYWRKRFASFNLDRVAEEFPTDEFETLNAIENLRVLTLETFSKKQPL